MVRKEVTETEASEMALEGRGDTVTKVDITKDVSVLVLTRPVSY